MDVVPVIDLMRGQVVRAVRGDRQTYRPIVSALCPGSDPVTLAQALCRHNESRRLYAADLDALTGGTAQLSVLHALLSALPELELWLDAGFADAQSAQTVCTALGAAAARVVPVFGSESIRSAGALAELAGGNQRWILSLDRRGGERLDRAGCWEAAEHWPAELIVMTLERVGADSGPDLQTLRAVQTRAPHARLIGAGGIRGAADLRAAAAAGAQAWLVASALHDGRL